MTIPSNWYENFFHGLALDLWRKALPPEHTKAEADFLAQALQCNARSHLLDVPCGNGRLSFELARRGYRVTGVDIAEEFTKLIVFQRSYSANARIITTTDEISQETINLKR